MEHSLADFLDERGASTFREFFYRYPDIYESANDYTAILAPDNEAMDRLFESGFDGSDQSIFEFLYDHISNIEIKKQGWPVITFLSGLEFGESMDDLIKLDIRVVTKLNNVTVMVIGKVLVHTPHENAAYFESLPRDVFRELILTGGIVGKDVISLCSTNVAIRAKCNYNDGELFKFLLMKEYGELEFNNPKLSYMQRMKSGVFIAGHQIIKGPGPNSIMADRRKIMDGIGIKQMSTVLIHALFLDVNGNVLSMGHNVGGQLGYGEITLGNFERPQPVSIPVKASQIATTSFSSYILDITGRIWHFGYDIFEPGAEIKMISLPTLIPINETFVQISANYGNLVALDNKGSIWVFGLDSAKYFGFESRNDIPYTRLKNFTNVKQVSLGSDHIAILDSDGNLFVIGEFNGVYYTKPLILRGYSGILKIAAGAGYTAFIDRNYDPWVVGDIKLINGLNIQPVDRDFRNPILIPGPRKAKKISCFEGYLSVIDHDNNLWRYYSVNLSPTQKIEPNPTNNVHDVEQAYGYVLVIK